MIVSDKEASLKKANEISNKILALIIEEIKNFSCDDDPAEQIYLECHVVGNLLAKICISLENFGETYSIPNLSTKSINEWINIIAEENIKFNRSLMKQD